MEAAFWRACPFTPRRVRSPSARRVDPHRARRSRQQRGRHRAVAASPSRIPTSARSGGRSPTPSIETALASIPGFYGLSGGPSAASPYGVYRPALVAGRARAAVRPRRRLGPSRSNRRSRRTVEAGDRPGRRVARRRRRDRARPTACAARASSSAPARATRAATPTSGCSPAPTQAFEWLAGFLTVDRLRELLPETAELPVERYVCRNLRSLNFVITGLLEEGVAASSRIDAQAKSLGEWLRARHRRRPRRPAARLTTR